jgi:hypothetical protein
MTGMDLTDRSGGGVFSLERFKVLQAEGAENRKYQPRTNSISEWSAMPMHTQQVISSLGLNND